MAKKTLVIMLILGLVFGLIVGYSVAPKGNTTVLERQITELEGQLSAFQSQIKDKDEVISNLESQIREKDGIISKLEIKLSEKEAQVADLEAQISTLQEEVKLVHPYRKGEWNLIETFKGSSSMTTDYFYLAGADVRINWTWTSEVPEYVGFSFSLYKEEEATWTAFQFDLDSIGTTHVHNLEITNYYLEVSEANIDEWTLTVEVWIPE